MNTILTLYWKNKKQEFIFPNINNSDYTLIIPPNVFDKVNDLCIQCDVIENVWRIFSTDQYVIRVKSGLAESIRLDDGIVFSLEYHNHTTIRAVVIISKKNHLISPKYVMKTPSITIGRAETNDICCNDPYIGRSHARIFQHGAGWFVEDTSKNGIYLNNLRVFEKSQLRFGDCISISHLKLVVLNNGVALNTDVGFKVNPKTLEPYKPFYSAISHGFVERNYFNRAPRIMETPHTEAIEIEGPPSPKNDTERSLFATIGPAFTMAIPMLAGFGAMYFFSKSNGSNSNTFMVFGLITAVLSAVIGAFWGLYNYNSAKKKSREDEYHRLSAYNEYLKKSDQKIGAVYNENIRIMRSAYKSARKCCALDERSPELWNRNSKHKDFLTHRIGYGNMHFQVQVQIPKERFSLVYDSLSEKPAEIKSKYEQLRNVPSCVSLSENSIIGIVGGHEKKGVWAPVKSLIAQIAANNCYTDVKIVYLSTNDPINLLDRIKWLPHCWSDDKKLRYCAKSMAEISDICYELTQIFRVRSENENQRSSSTPLALPHFVIFAEDYALLLGEPVLKYLFEERGRCGVTLILLSENYEALPNMCECIIYNDGHFRGIYSTENMSSLGDHMVFDDVVDADLERFARRISGIRVSEMTSSGEIPQSISFLDMYHIRRISQLNASDRWKKNKTYESMKALIGQKSGGVDCYLDINEKYHGPHGLVAGTTGSGKSETLQTYILSLAVNFGPDDVGFLIIDFKGGGMANLFDDLPHLMGKISDLSGNQIKRSMISIKSENMRRKRIFSELGINNIDAYTRMYKNHEVREPMPHLLIIIDEFAELKREQPEFMAELISVAQVGRSLGVHLILATQKPGGTVDDNIRSNSRFKLCLRVQDKQDSVDMIGRPDAAFLPQAGRCFLQVGNNEIFELFQSGWSGAPYDESFADVKTNAVALVSNTGKNIIVGGRTAGRQRAATQRQWIEAIVDCIRTICKKESILISNLCFDEDLQTVLIDQLYNEFEKRGIEYADTVAARKALLHLIILYADNSRGDANDLIIAGREQGLSLPVPKEKNQLEATIQYLKKTASESGFVSHPTLWLPPLPTWLTVEMIQGKNQDTLCLQTPVTPVQALSVKLGLFDNPAGQSQPVLEADFFKDGNLAVYGSAGSGKSTFMQTMMWNLITTYSPETVQIYAIDFSNHLLQSFEDAPHVGAVMNELQTEKIDRFFFMLNQILSQRKQMMEGGGFTQYIRINGNVMPAVIVVIDNYTSFREKTEDRYESVIWEISRDGSNFGIFLAFTAGGTGTVGIQLKIADNLKNVFCLSMSEKTKYADLLHVSRIETEPEIGVGGRGISMMSGYVLEFQTAVCIDVSNDYERSQAIEKICAAAAENYSGIFAPPIPEIPENPDWTAISCNPHYQTAISDVYTLPFAYNEKTADVFSLDLRDTYCFTVVGNARSGRTETLKSLIGAAKQKRGRVYILDGVQNELKRFSEKWADGYYSGAEEIFDFTVELSSAFRSRNQIKRELIDSGIYERDLFEEMRKQEPIFVFVADTSSFFNTIYTSMPGKPAMAPTYENLLEKGRLHNIYFFFDIKADDGLLVSRKLYGIITGYKTGVFVGGNMFSQRVFDTTSIPGVLSSRSLPLGVGAVFTNKGCTRIVIPLSIGM